jgi:hypothetical protein
VPDIQMWDTLLKVSYPDSVTGLLVLKCFITEFHSRDEFKFPSVKNLDYVTVERKSLVAL